VFNSTKHEREEQHIRELTKEEKRWETARKTKRWQQKSESKMTNKLQLESHQSHRDGTLIKPSEMGNAKTGM
jgi:hypothetical protein